MDNQDSALNMEEHASNELLVDSDVESEISFASCSRQSDSLKSESLTNSSGELNDQTSQEVTQDLSESSISHSISCFTSVLHKIDEKESNIGKLSSLLQNMHQSVNMNEFNDTESSNQMKEPESITSPSKTKLRTPKQEMKNLETTRGEIVENLTPFASGLYQTVFPPFIQNKVSAKGKESKVNKKFDKNKILSTQVLSNELYNENNNKSKISLKDNDASSVSRSCENNFKFAGNEMNVQGDRVSQDFQRLIQRLDSLVSALEIMTADMKRDINLKNDKGLIKCVCSKEPYCEFRVPYCSCSAHTIPSHICRKICNTIKYNSRAYTNVHPCQSNIKVAHDCCCVCKA